MQGMIQGGWEYVIAVYCITWTALVFYAVSLLIRGRKGEPS